MTSPETRSSRQVRQDFFDFFKSKQHTIAPSSSLMPDAPNLLFTNAGMNQFVPIFLGQKRADVSKWAGVIAGLDTRAADTQKCIRAGGKHNDLEDVGFDTYHHTFFEMLGNWSFGDYFKKEAIEWAWELITGVWNFPKGRLYATVYKPGPGDPAEFDQEACDHWTRLFVAAGLDPTAHIRTGGKKDNFWMMGDTGPCGPCSEIHIDLTPAGDTQGKLVNAGSAQCIEIWNLVFIQFNANPDGTFSPLPARHVDTGMGFERVTSMMQCTRNFSDFSRVVSNYETDIFRPLFDAIERLCGKKYGSTLPPAELSTLSPQQSTDVAFRVIADHIRTQGFAIADGIQPSNEGRGYVLRRILRRAVRYGRTLGFHEPFFYKLVDVLAETMGDVFPEIRAKQPHVKDVIRTEEEAFNKTLDRGIELFTEEATRLVGATPAASTGDARRPGMGSARVSRAGSGVPPEPSAVAEAKYSKRRLPHFERPWAKYMVTFSTAGRRQLAPDARDIVLKSLLFGQEQRRYQLYAACVMPDHVHLLFEPQIKEEDKDGKSVFWSLTELLHSIKSFTAHEINEAQGTKGQSVWERESLDRMIRGATDLEEKFHYICRNPWDSGIASPTENYPWLWTPEAPRRDAEESTRDACAPPTTASTPRTTAGGLSGEFAFKLYDTYGFPLDLTELMARERGLTVDVEGFNKLMEEQRERARKAQKKTIIEVVEAFRGRGPTEFVGYDKLQVETEFGGHKGSDYFVTVSTPFYAEMGGQVGDSGWLEVPDEKGGQRAFRIVNTTKTPNGVYLHMIDPEETNLVLPPVEGDKPRPVFLRVDRPRRSAIQRHHTATHLLHWALHEVVSKDATQKGSYVGPEKLTFDFNNPPLAPQQVADVEKLVNERLLENAGVSWTEVPYVDIRGRKDVMQFFGDKYGDVVRVVQIGGRAGKLDGYSMELCGGTHTRATGEIGLFRIVAEGAIAAGVRRIEAVAGLEAYRRANDELQLVKTIAGRVNSPVGELERKIETLLEQQKALEKQLRAFAQKQAAESAKGLLSRAVTLNGVPAIIENCGPIDGDTVQAMVNELKGQFKGVIVLGGAANGAVALVAAVSPEFTAKVQAGKIIQQIAPLVGGKGGGKPDNARGGGKEVAKLEEALAKAKALLG